MIEEQCAYGEEGLEGGVAGGVWDVRQGTEGGKVLTLCQHCSSALQVALELCH